MQKRLLFSSPLLDITLRRLGQTLIENHQDFAESVLLGMQPRGVFFAERLRARLTTMTGRQLPLGYLDATFYRDDFRRRDAPLIPSVNNVPFPIENKRVILIDDVLFTGRTVRAALDALTALGRPRSVELLVLIDRQYSRDLPIEPNYVGMRVNTVQSQRVLVEWTEQGSEEDRIWLID